MHRTVLPPLKWRESPNQSPRLEIVRLVVVHRPVASYSSAINTLCTPRGKDSTSAHCVVREDGREATQLVPWSRKAWACSAFNSASVNVETPDWIWAAATRDHSNVERLRVMRECARIVAFLLHKFELGSHYLTGTHLLNSTGFTRHLDLGAAGGGHTDPTEDITRWHQFSAMTIEESARGGFRKTYGKT